MFAPGLSQVMKEFHSTSGPLASFVVSIYILGYAIGPLLMAPLPELYGRLPVYHISNALFIIFTVACAVSNNLGMLLAFRFLDGCVGSTPLVLGGGSISDLITQEKRGGAIAIWAMGPLMGPVIGPISGGYLAQSLGWRWVFWVITIAVG
jgi:multidrug resistance protein